MQTRTAKELAGIAVVTTSGGERLGRVTDVVFDAQSGHALGFVVHIGGLLSHARFLPSAEIEALGADAVTVRRPDALSETLPPHDTFPTLSARTLEGRPVLNEGGTVLGNVSDALVSEDLTVPGLTLSTGFFSTALHGHPHLPLAAIQTVGPDSVVVLNTYDIKAP